MPKTVKWNYQKRMNLEYLLKEGYGVTEIVEMLHVSRPLIITEIKKGLSGEDAKNHRWVKYSSDLSLEAYVIDIIGEEGLNALVRYENGKSKG